MVRRLWPAGGKARLAVVGAALILVCVVLIWLTRRDTLPSLQSMNIGTPSVKTIPVVQGAEWKAGTVDSEGFAAAAENGKFKLLLEAKTGRIAVLNKLSGYTWRSNPTQAQLAKETVKGSLLENLQSPYILEYTMGTETKRSVTNALDPKLSVRYTAIGTNGIQAEYTHTALKLSFVIQYTLTDHGIEAAVPDEGIKEEGDARLFSLNLLPFFGAVGAKEELGYLFVPDGPGGLIYFDRTRPNIGNVYDFPIYGDDPANLKNQGEPNMTALRQPITFPVYGLKRGNDAFTAVVKQGQFTASVKATLPGNISGFHTVSAVFSYRQEYGRKVSGITKEVVITVQSARVHEDRRVEFRLLSGNDANYVGMAASYRSYLEEGGQLPPALQATDNVPMELTLVGGASKKKFGGTRYEPTTTFDQAKRIVEELRQQGVGNLRIVYEGWQHSGFAMSDGRFPIAAAVGGTSGAKRFVQAMHTEGVKVLFEDSLTFKAADHTSFFFVKSDGIRGIDSAVFQDFSKNFIVNPVKEIRAQKQVIAKLKDIGVDGLHYIDGPGNEVFSDYNSASPLSRYDTGHYYQALLDYTRSELGMAGVYRGNDYSLSHVDYIEALPTESNYDFMIDETVPFYPMVVHGNVEYTTTAGNLRDINDDQLLRAIEYGAVPYFRLTDSPSRLLKDTSYKAVYSGEFALWKDRVIAEYKKFNQLASVYNQRMTGHERISEGIYKTTYANGVSVTVNYSTKQFTVEGGKAG